MRLMISYPTSGTHCAAFGYSLVNMVGYLLTADPIPDFSFQVGLAQGSNWIENREDIADRAVAGGFTHLCFLDDDMVFAPDVLVSMVNHAKQGRDIVLTNYLVKEWPPKTFTAMGMDGDRCKTTEAKSGLEEVLGSGFGVSIINLDVFKAVPKPWFMPTWSKEQGYSTEDLPFFRKAREKGYRAWLDHDASKKVAHNGAKQWHWREAVA